MATILNKRSALAATPNKSYARMVPSRSGLVVRAQKEESSPLFVDRRVALVSLGVALPIFFDTAPSLAGYGDSANVFGRRTNVSGFIPYVGEGFAVTLPAKWNPSKEQDLPGTVLRYEDNFDAVNNFVISAVPTDKSSISAYGTPDKFLDQVSFVLGKQSYAGETKSEGGFAPNRVSAASILDISSSTDKKGNEYYQYELLTRTADGNEGGRHQLIKATVAQGKLWVLLVRCGDKRWFKGTKKEATTIFDSFLVA